MKRGRIAMLALLAVIFGACAVIEPPPEAVSSGTVRVSVAGNGQRTIIPQAPAEFTKYSFGFEALGGQAAPERQWLEDGETELEVGLMPGNWVITATGYAHITGYEAQGIPNGDYPAAQGAAEVLVEAGETLNVSIALECGARAGEQGVLEWDAELPASASSAYMELRAVGEMELLENVNLKDAPGGAAAVESGYYLLTLRIDGIAVKSEALHVYGGAVSRFEWKPITDLNELISLLNSLPGNTRETPYTARLSGFDLETAFSSSNSSLSNAMNNKYLYLDLGWCAGTAMGTLNAFSKSYVTGVALPESLTAIGNYAFQNCTSLTGITLPEGVTTIGNSAFGGCTSLTGITLPESLTAIGGSAFYQCTSLTSVNIPASVISIGDYAFSNCTSLTEITLPDSVTTIGNNAFQYCRNLTEITLPESLTAIGDYAFQSCLSLTEITLPVGVTTIGDNAFQDTGLTEITLPEGVTSIAKGTFSRCVNLKEINMPGVVSIDYYYTTGMWSYDDGAFSGCMSLTEITLPENLTSIGNYAFDKCRNLKKIVLPAGVVSIGKGAFQYCTSLTEITLPAGLTSIDDAPSYWNDYTGAFWYCAALETVTCKAETPPSLITDIVAYRHPFEFTSANMEIFVPAESLDAYKNAEGWSYYAGKIKPIVN